MARAAVRGALCLRPSSFSSSFRRLLGSEAALDPAECVDDASFKSLQGQSVKAEANESGSSKWRANNLRTFLEEQTIFLIEVQNQLKDQRELLSLIHEELRFYKSEPKTRKELALSTRNVSSQTNKELVCEIASDLCETKAENVQCTRTTHCEISDNGEPVAENIKNGFDADKLQHPPWPEWELFLNHLRPYACVEEKKPKDECGDLFDCTTVLKHAIVKFARTHEATFRTLSRKDLAMLVQHEFPSMDERTAAGKKRIRDYLVMDESKVTQAKLTDVVRLIYRAVRSIPSLGGALPNAVKSSIVHLLQELVSATITKHDGLSGTIEGISQKVDKGDETERVNTMTNMVDGDSSNRSIEGIDQKIAEGGEIERLNNMTNMVYGEAVPPLTSPSATLTSLELPKFESLKERVDARRARLARESKEKEASKALLPEPLLTKELEQKTLKACSPQMDKSKADVEVVRNFRAFDAIIESEDSDGCVRSKAQPKRVSKPSLSRLVQNAFSMHNKGAQHLIGK